jgi:hypothetical protein
MKYQRFTGTFNKTNNFDCGVVVLVNFVRNIWQNWQEILCRNLVVTLCQGLHKQINNTTLVECI